MYFTAIHTFLQRRLVVLRNFMGKTSVITTSRRCVKFLYVQQYINPASEGGLAVNKVIFLDVDGVLNNGTWAIEIAGASDATIADWISGKESQDAPAPGASGA